MVDTLQRDLLRKPLLKQRRALTTEARVNAGVRLLQNLQQYLGNKIPAHAAGYLSVGGEIDLSPALHWLRQQGCKTWLPIIREQFNGQLRFAPFTDSTNFVIGQHFKIPEPEFDDTDLCCANDLDLVLVPLVAFDHNGNRLGMGGGYYDKSFSYRLNQRMPSQQFVGVAHEFQSLDTVPSEHWDVPLDTVLTEEHIYTMAGN